MKIRFIDSGREPKNPPNPAYPNGLDVDLSHGKPSCSTSVPYPSPRCGMLEVYCEICGYRALVTVAGRKDDPRSVTVPCKKGTLN